MPRPVAVPRVTPVRISPDAGGAKPKTPDTHARSACPASTNSATNDTIDLVFDVGPSSALQAAGLAGNSEIAAEGAPAMRRGSHGAPRRRARAASACASVEMYTSIGPEPRHTFKPAGISADCRTASVGVVCGVGLGRGLATTGGALL